jgi:hypothetical protein
MMQNPSHQERLVKLETFCRETAETGTFPADVDPMKWIRQAERGIVGWHEIGFHLITEQR